MLRFPARNTAQPAVHLTALIDIVFLLLVFFLLASNFVEQQGVPIAVPQVESRGEPLPPQVMVDIDRHGGLSVDGVAVTQARLVDVLAARLGPGQTATVTVRADRRVAYDTVVQAVDAANLAGAGKVLLVARRLVPERGG